MFIEFGHVNIWRISIDHSIILKTYVVFWVVFLHYIRLAAVFRNDVFYFFQYMLIFGWHTWWEKIPCFLASLNFIICKLSAVSVIHLHVIKYLEKTESFFFFNLNFQIAFLFLLVADYLLWISMYKPKEIQHPGSTCITDK